MDYSLPGFSVRGISMDSIQARIRKCVAISFSRGSAQPRDWTCISYIFRWVLYHWATREARISDLQVMLHSWQSKCPVPLAVAEADLRSCFPWWLSGKEPTGQCRRHGFHPWVGQMPWRNKRQPTLVFLPGESHGQKSLEGYSSWVAESAQRRRRAGILLLGWLEKKPLLCCKHQSLSSLAPCT